MFKGSNGKSCATVKSEKITEKYPKLAALKMSNPNIKTTTEISTEIKVEVMLETAHIVSVPGTAVTLTNDGQSTSQESANEKSCKAIKAEREAKKLAKQARKDKANENKMNDALNDAAFNTNQHVGNNEEKEEKTRDQVKAEREARKLAKQQAKAKKTNIGDDVPEKPDVVIKDVCAPAREEINEKKKPALTKAERRAIQEAQRAAKAQAQAQKSNTKTSALKIKPTTETTPITSNKVTKSPEKVPIERVNSVQATPTKHVLMNDGNIKLFSHLERPNINVNLFINHTQIHPSVVRLGEQYAKRTVVGSNARCVAFLNAIKMVIQDFETPPKKEFGRSLEAFIKNCVSYLNTCRMLAVSVINAHKYIKQMLTQLPNNQPESELKNKLFCLIDTYIENQIDKAAQAINSTMQQKITNGDVILTFGCSSLINYILEAAHDRQIDFRVIIVDSRPFCEGREMLRRLSVKGISCTYVLINAISFVMPEVTKILLGAHALLANGYVMSRTGTSQVALVARSFNVPVLVCCETHKFSERFQTDAIVYNELDNPEDLVVDDKCCLVNWQTKPKLSPLNLNYDITPPELVNAVITEVAVLPCTSVPVILRMKPDWLMYAT